MRPAAALALLAAGCAAGRSAEAPPAVAAGAAVSCIPIASIRESRVRSDRVIDFVTTGRRVYRNTLPYDCPGLGFERRFAYSTSLTQLCSLDVVTVFTTSPVQRGATCGLGPFQPVTLPRSRR